MTMIMSSNLYCRLCMTTKSLSAMTIDIITELSSLITELRFCSDLQIQDESYIPNLICKKCEKKVKKFSHFKQKCFKVDKKLRLIYLSSEGNSCSNNNLDNGSVEQNTKTIEEDIEDAYCDQIRIDEIVEIDRNIYKKDPFMFLCDICGLCFYSKLKLKNHKRSHNILTKQSYKCKFCVKSFARSETYIKHINSHKEKRPFLCVICGLSTARNNDLKRHMKIHSEERNHSCPKCGKQFKRSADVHTHMRTHTGVRPYKCKICTKDYTSHGGLRKHIKSHKLE